MYFELLQNRLIVVVRNKVQNGDFTERRLARLTGVSQPHMHNVLKGARPLTPALADEILRHLNLTLIDLLDPVELKTHSAMKGNRVFRQFRKGAGVYRGSERFAAVSV